MSPSESTPEDAKWRERLSPEVFQIAREGGTERPFTGAYWNEKGEGEYHCVCCDAPLFLSDEKYDSRSGWPSFWKPAPGARIRRVQDQSHGMTRVEVRCEACDAHLGHLFPDGPPPTGMRYCINSASLRFDPAGKASSGNPSD